MSKYKIAFGAPLTGDQDIVGVPMLQMVKYVVDLLKGDLDIEAVGYDDRAESEPALRCAKEIVADPSVLAVIHKNSDCLAAGAPLYEAAGLPFLTASSTNYQLTHSGYGNIRRFCAHDNFQARIPAKYGVETLGLKKMAVLHDGTSYGQPLAEEFKNYAESLGAETVLFLEIPVGTKEYDGIVEKIKSSGAQGVYMGLTEIEGNLTMKALYDNGVKVQIFGADANPSQLLMLAGPEAAEGTVVTCAGMPISEGSEAYKALAGYLEKYPEIPVFSGELYDIIDFLMRAIKSLDDPKREDMMKAVQAVEPFEGLTGAVNFDENGDKTSAAITLWRIENNGMTYLGTFVKEQVGL